MSPLSKQPHEPNAYNRRLKYVGRCNITMARLVAPHITNPHVLAHLIETTRRDIYAETCEAMGYDPLERQRHEHGH